MALFVDGLSFRSNFFVHYQHGLNDPLPSLELNYLTCILCITSYRFELWMNAVSCTFNTHYVICNNVITTVNLSFSRALFLFCKWKTVIGLTTTVECKTTYTKSDNNKFLRCSKNLFWYGRYIVTCFWGNTCICYGNNVCFVCKKGVLFASSGVLTLFSLSANYYVRFLQIS